MKKLFIYLLAFTATLMLDSCINNDDPVSKQSVTVTVNNRAINGQQVIFSQGSAKVEVNYTDQTIQFSTDFKDAQNQQRSISTPVMDMTFTKLGLYHFQTVVSQASSSISGLDGYLDTNTGVLWFTINDNAGQVYSTSQLLYGYVTTTVTNPDNGNHFNHEQSAYLFTIDPKGETCILSISNFVPNIVGTVQETEIRYDGLKVTPTLTGYTVTADKVESNFKNMYTITDLTFNLNDQCRVISGSFKCSALDFTVSGRLLPQAN